jgi:hypothetical protein
LGTPESQLIQIIKELSRKRSAQWLNFSERGSGNRYGEGEEQTRRLPEISARTLIRIPGIFPWVLPKIVLDLQRSLGF